MNTLHIILVALAAVSLAVGIIGAVAFRGKTDDKKRKKKKTLFTCLAVFGGWLLIGTVISAFYDGFVGLRIEFELLSSRINIFGFSIARTTFLALIITFIVTVLSLVFRFLVFPHFDMQKPKGFQNVMEIAVEAMENFAKDNLHDYSGVLAPYMFSLAVFMIFSALTELIGERPPTADLVMTLGMGLITFVLINVFGIRKKGIGGRIKALSNPTPVVFPMKILSDVAVPVSLACRLFGNMLGGMIVMDLLKTVLGGYAVGIPAVAGLYFNVFHPLIQAYIFVILSMTFINEAIE